MPDNKKSMISQLQAVGEGALGKLASNDVARKLTNNEVARSALQTAMNLKERAEKSLTGFDAIEKRLDAIEKRLADLEGTKKSSSRSGSGKAASSAKDDEAEKAESSASS